MISCALLFCLSACLPLCPAAHAAPLPALRLPSLFSPYLPVRHPHVCMYLSVGRVLSVGLTNDHSLLNS